MVNTLIFLGFFCLTLANKMNTFFLCSSSLCTVCVTNLYIFVAVVVVVSLGGVADVAAPASLRVRIFFWRKVSLVVVEIANSEHVQ